MFDRYDSQEEKEKENLVLVPLSHEEIEYEKFEKSFYKPLPELSNLSPQDCQNKRKEAEIRVVGEGDLPAPVDTFEQLQLHPKLFEAIQKQGFDIPTPIQRQALPVALSGRNMIGIAKTGSGKTAAFVIPLIPHILAQRPLGKGEGPIAVIVAPSRELARQIFKETKKYTKPFKFE